MILRKPVIWLLSRMPSEFFYFLSAVLLGGAMNGLFAALVQWEGHTREELISITFLMLLWGILLWIWAWQAADLAKRIFISEEGRSGIRDKKADFIGYCSLFVLTVTITVIYRILE